MRWLAVLVEFMLATLLTVAAVWCWRNGIQHTWFQPVGDAPGFEAVRYSGPWLALSAGTVIIAGLLLIDLVTRAFRRAH
ncbi:hypothetical protein JK358_14970 [Nocardia sp. 2]|uniref:Uncharacterized protein n=1 Tax=Nocardia acididurans TaxID=2802282 RepID=A0ABS1M523_9NOCA|nr:hypothetical protein [Nocardia acididurans]MBL1075695.1 hypothetical protein [Nocardia acididurans]